MSIEQDIDPWEVVETPCFPNTWKVRPTHTYREDNLLSRFFDSKIAAQVEADRLNAEYRGRLE